jgi:prevent-host-death family protein
MADRDAVSVRELRSHLADYLRRAHDGETFVVSRAGRPDAQLGPVARTSDVDD